MDTDTDMVMVIVTGTGIHTDVEMERGTETAATHAQRPQSLLRMRILRADMEVVVVVVAHEFRRLFRLRVRVRVEWVEKRGSRIVREMGRCRGMGGSMDLDGLVSRLGWLILTRLREGKDLPSFIITLQPHSLTCSLVRSYRLTFIYRSIRYLFGMTYEHSDDMTITSLMNYLNAAMPIDKHEDFDLAEVTKAVRGLSERGKIAVDNNELIRPV